MDWLQDAGALVLVFLGGLLAPAAGNAVNALVSSRVGRNDRTREQAATRARLASEQCYEELSKLADIIPKYASADRRTSGINASESDEEAYKQLRSAHDSAVAGLEANIVLLPGKVREEMEYVLGLLRYAYDLTYRPNPGTQMDVGWHPDSARTIANELTRHARAVLASHLTGTTLPTRSDQVIEYELAVKDRDDDFNDYYSDFIEEDQTRLRRWRANHDLPEQRTARPPR